jgi:hypothetical protein
LFALLKAPYGTAAVRLWTEAWLTGQVPPEAVAIWTSGFVKPLGKKSGEGVRPITMFETLLKLATGLALDVSKKDIIKGVGNFQYGALMSAGADKMVYNLRSLAAATPNHLFIATDVKNAFGSVPRQRALASLLKHTPQLAPIMSLFWKCPHTELLTPDGPDHLASLSVTQGVFQGECLSTAIFCIFLRDVVDQFFTALSTLELPAPFNDRPTHSLVTFLAYVDDVVLAFHPDLFDFA